MALRKNENTDETKPRNATDEVRGIEVSLETMLDPVLFNFCVWYTNTKKGKAIKAVCNLRDVVVKENDKIILQFENYTMADTAHRNLFYELRSYFKGKLLCFEFDDWDVRPECEALMSAIAQRLRKSFAYKAPCMCYGCMTVRGESPKVVDDGELNEFN